MLETSATNVATTIVNCHHFFPSFCSITRLRAAFAANKVAQIVALHTDNRNSIFNFFKQIDGFLRAGYTCSLFGVL